MKKHSILVILLISLLYSCVKEKKRLVAFHNTLNSKEFLKSETLQSWYFKDLEKDTVPGISLERLYSELILNKKGLPIIVAVLDKPIDTNHDKLKQLIWKNGQEISGNSIDDDGNGYIDDVHGWNFMGGTDGLVTDVQWVSSLRFIKKYDSLFFLEQNGSHSVVNTSFYDALSRAKEDFEKQNIKANEDLKYAKMIKHILISTKEYLKPYFPNEDYGLKDLDSLKLSHPEDSLLGKQILKRYNFIKYGFTEQYIENNLWEAENKKEKSLNINYNERYIQQDDPNNIYDVFYGNNLVNKYSDKFTHGTRVSGAIGFPLFFENRNDNPIKILPVVISAFGERHSKDIIAGIIYAVDNGAKVINLSFSTKFMIYEKELRNALMYAASKDVLVVRAGGNDNANINANNLIEFPNDVDGLQKEFTDNFILVGSSTYHLKAKLKSKFSSYGKEQIDVFAPGDSIYTTFPNNKLDFERGTSMSTAVVSSVAALLFSYYPTLTAAEVKQIIMESGVEYDIPVSVPTKENPDQLLPFNQLSKSGKIVNAYNAFILADSVVKSNKRKK